MGPRNLDRELVVRHQVGGAMLIAGIDFDAILSAVRLAGYGDDVDWAEGLKPPETAEDFALEIVFVICNSGMRFTVAREIYKRVVVRLQACAAVLDVFRHEGKAAAIELVWKDRARLFAEYLAAPDKLWYLETLPWVGKITKYHAAKNFALQYAKPDVHLQRLADTLKTNPQALCEVISQRTGWKVATVDTVLWRAAAIGLLDTATGRLKAS